MSDIIADVGANHCGQNKLIIAHIKEARVNGANIVKFQAWQADKLIKTYPQYEKEYRYYKSHELSDDQCKLVVEYADYCWIKPLFTVFDVDRVDFIASLGDKMVKVASPDANSWRLLGKCFDKFEHVIISTGMHTAKEIDDLYRWLWYHRFEDRVTLMHCVSMYPLQYRNVNLEFINVLKQYNTKVGYSDHTEGIDAACVAIAMGVDYVEKHFTLSNALEAKDAAMSATPSVLKQIYEFNLTCCQLKYGVFSDTKRTMDISGRNKYIGRWGDNK